ncbi:RND family transporter [Mycolicibacter minnesotensis]
MAVGIGVNVGWPQLEVVANQHSVSPLPSEDQSPALKSMRSMAASFGQPGIDNAAIIVLKSENGLDADARLHYNALIERLQNEQHVTFVADLLNDSQLQLNPMARKQVMSEDGKVWFVALGLKGDMGSPEALRSYRAVQDLVDQTFEGSDTAVYLTGTTAVMSDLARVGAADLPKIAAITVVVIGVILMIVFRSVFTAGLPLVVMGVSLMVARGIVAGLAGLDLLPISSGSGALMMAVLMGASVNYTVFIIGRYHERLRAGESPDEALPRACGSMARVILAAAATVAIANVAQLTARLKALSAVGPSVCIAIIVAFSVAVTLLPAAMSLAAKRNLGLAGTERTRRLWRRAGVLVVRRPGLVFGASTAAMLVLATFAVMIRPSYDMNSSLPSSVPSAAGLTLLNAAFPMAVAMPQYLLIESPRDLRTPQGLADLDNLAGRIAQMPGVERVVGLTRPDGNKLTQATLAWQIGYMGTRMESTSQQVGEELQPQLDRMTKIADIVTAMMSQLDVGELTRLKSIVDQTLSSAQIVGDQARQYQRILNQLNETNQGLARLMQSAPTLDGVTAALDGADAMVRPLRDALNASPFCPMTPQCSELRDQVNAYSSWGDNELVAQLRNLSATIKSVSGGRPADQMLQDISGRLASVSSLLDRMPDFRAKYDTFNSYYQQLQALGVNVEMSQNLGERVHQLNAQMQDTMGAMTQAAAFLQTIGTDASSPAASGFYLPPALMSNPNFVDAAKVFIQDDGHTAMYMVDSSLNPYGQEAMALTKAMARVGAEATPNTSLDGAQVSIGGFPAINADLNTAFKRDFAEIMVVTLLVIFVVMCLLLRAVVAPIYLLGTVVLTYVSAVGLGVLVFQEILGSEIQWAIPAMSFVMIVAVGADYNMLFISRLREEVAAGTRIGIMRTVSHTGSVITSAGMIFAATLMGMMAGSLDQMVQMGFIIGMGILLDTFVVRTFMVPALAKVFGTSSWWPSRNVGGGG